MTAQPPKIAIYVPKEASSCQSLGYSRYLIEGLVYVKNEQTSAEPKRCTNLGKRLDEMLLYIAS